jgi:eukaryotic-like serine/threonine-protein kinase
MQFRRHMPPIREWKWPRLVRGARLPAMERRHVVRWAFWLGVAAVLGYLAVAVFVFPSPMFPHRQVVPRVLGLPIAEARRDIAATKLGIIDNGSEPHPTAPAGTVIWQDPPPGVVAPANLRVALTVSAGPPRIPVPDVAGLDVDLASRLIAAAGLRVGRVDSVQAAVPPGVAMQTRPVAATAVAPGTRVGIVVSRGAPTITVPDLMGLSPLDARVRLEQAGLDMGGITRRRTPGLTPGTVMGQRPAAGTLAAPGTLVDVILARSPQ